MSMHVARGRAVEPPLTDKMSFHENSDGQNVVIHKIRYHTILVYYFWLQYDEKSRGTSVYVVPNYEELKN